MISGLALLPPTDDEPNPFKRVVRQRRGKTGIALPRRAAVTLVFTTPDHGLFLPGRLHRAVFFRLRCSLAASISFKSAVGRISTGPSPYLKPYKGTPSI
jgi:hypothetical protein